MIPFRKQLRLSVLAAEVTGSMRFIWKFLRQYTVWVNKTYNRVKRIAESRGIKIPKTKINMEVEE